jgi:hypothetical protein
LFKDEKNEGVVLQEKGGNAKFKSYQNFDKDDK